MVRPAAIAIAAACLWPAGSWAQATPPDDADQMRFREPIVTGAPPGFKRIDQGVEDLNALQTTLKSTASSVDMRAPTGFKDVYRGPDGRMYRFDGAIGASFPQSEYFVNKDQQLEILIPGGTIFYIGQPWNLARPLASQALSSPNRTDAGSSSQVTGSALASARNNVASRGMVGTVNVLVSALPPEAAPAPTGEGTITGDAAYRAARIASLLREASEAGASEQPR
ncbi:MAG: hypothetical protein IBJ10_10390 [Phycisphaerales bacterium]|nr:hypothetical protein [Phycisphaerales bacterium]